MNRDPGDTQGNVLRGYTHLRHVAYWFFRIVDPTGARAVLAELAPEVSSDEKWANKHEVRNTLNIAFTHSGLAKLGLQAPFDAPEFSDFKEGMYARARVCLGDRGENDPDNWEPELRDSAHVVCTIYWDGSEARKHDLQSTRDRLEGSGLEGVHHQGADTLRRHREQFGFTDGFSQPVLVPPGDEEAARSVEGEGVLEPANLWKGRLRPHWRPVRLGEFLLGHRDEDDTTPGADHPWLHNGTFMVWRKLQQHRRRFDEFFDRIDGKDPERRAWLQAKVVGRWPDGTSLLDAPYHAPSRRRPDGMPNNAFVYRNDPAGVSCPVGAHVRRAYPRDGLGWWTHRTRRHRIIRRGVPYEDADGTCGLIFVCFNASIARQFELIQGHWLMDGDAFGLGADRDVLVGYQDGDGKMTIQGDRRTPATFLPQPDRPFVTTRGGYYLFVPGIRALKALA